MKRKNVLLVSLKRSFVNFPFYFNYSSQYLSCQRELITIVSTKGNHISLLEFLEPVNKVLGKGKIGNTVYVDFQKSF